MQTSFHTVMVLLATNPATTRDPSCFLTSDHLNPQAGTTSLPFPVEAGTFTAAGPTSVTVAGQDTAAGFVDTGFKLVIGGTRLTTAQRIRIVCDDADRPTERETQTPHTHARSLAARDPAVFL